MKHPLAVAAAMIAAAAAVVVLGLFSIQRLTPDAPSAGDADVKPAASAAGADDAYPDFSALAAKLRLTPAERDLLGKQDESGTPDMAAVEPLIARNAEALALFAAFSRRARFTNPHYLDPDKVGAETPIPQFFPLVAAARLSSLHAAAALRRDRAPEALEEALGVMDAGQVLLRSDQPIIASLVGMLVSDIGARRAREVVDSGKLDKARLLDAARRVSAHRGGAAALQSGLRFEYLGTANMLDHLPELSAKAPGDHWYHALAARSLYFYQPLRTRALYAGRFRGMIEEAAKPCLQARPPSHEPVTVDAGPNPLGRVLFNYAFPQYDKLYAKRCAGDFHAAALVAAAGLQAYRLDHKRRPAALSELVPGYLSSVPADPFTGAPLLYSPETGEVRSAGKDSDGKPL
ncbi:MAG: hypothetical protein PHS14_05270 [Elusimicrobia bacterium]|nr:hypothetical protein [Elusimicrobiota bacterium]